MEDILALLLENIFSDRKQDNSHQNKTATKRVSSLPTIDFN